MGLLSSMRHRLLLSVHHLFLSCGHAHCLAEVANRLQNFYEIDQSVLHSLLLLDALCQRRLGMAKLGFLEGDKGGLAHLNRLLSRLVLGFNR